MGLDPLAMIDRYSWDELYLVAEAISDVDIERIDLLAQPIVASNGGKWKGYADAIRRRRRAEERARAASGPDDLFAALASVGLADKPRS